MRCAAAHRASATGWKRALAGAWKKVSDCPTWIAGAGRLSVEGQNAALQPVSD